MSRDESTAKAFASSWNTLPPGSVYSPAQFEEWLLPLTSADICSREILELGCGNASLLVHLVDWCPRRVVGVDLGDSVLTAARNLETTGFEDHEVVRGDLVTFTSEGFDVVLCIGVLHHLVNPRLGFWSVLRNTKPGGRFHCWVYAREGNSVVLFLVEPLRRLTSRLPWWITKYLFATPLAVPFFIYSKLLAKVPGWVMVKRMPLYHYSRWIAQRSFAFFRHVAFDQLVTPRTVFIDRATIDRWLEEYSDEIDPGSIYVHFRNGNSWKIGGTRAL